MVSLNVRSIGSSVRRAVVFDYWSILKNVFCLQECSLRYDPPSSMNGKASHFGLQHVEKGMLGLHFLVKNY